jgi:hypothetical protein
MKQIKKHHNSHEQNTNIDPQHQKTKWATFTYNGKETRKITKFFKEAQIKIACRTRNTIESILKLHPKTGKYEKSGVYEMKFQDCQLKYICQMTEHSIPDTKNTYRQSGVITVIRDIQIIY